MLEKIAAAFGTTPRYLLKPVHFLAEVRAGVRLLSPQQREDLLLFVPGLAEAEDRRMAIDLGENYGLANFYLHARKARPPIGGVE
jgi:hypothetical protein